MLQDPDEEEEPGPIEKLQQAIVANVSLYAEKYEEEFAAYVGLQAKPGASPPTHGARTRDPTH